MTDSPQMLASEWERLVARLAQQGFEFENDSLAEQVRQIYFFGAAAAFCKLARAQSLPEAARTAVVEALRDEILGFDENMSSAIAKSFRGEFSHDGGMLRATE